MAVTFTPVFLRISSAVASSSDLVRALITRSTPSCASAMAQPLPKPLLAAQTIALRPLMPISIVSLPRGLLHARPDLCLTEHRRADIAAQAQRVVRLQRYVGVVNFAILGVVDVPVLEGLRIRRRLEAPDQR